MISLRAGTTPWLLAHELRVSATAAALLRPRIVALVILGVGLFTLITGLPIALALRRVWPGNIAVWLGTIDAVVVLAWTLMLSRALSAACEALYERGDLDLLLAAPLPGHRVIAVRAAGIAVFLFGCASVFATPIILPLAALLDWRWLSAYVVLGGLTGLAVAAGLVLAMGLFALLGPRRTRTVAHIIAALTGAAVYLLFQMQNLRPDSASRGILGWSEALGLAGLDPSSPWLFPARAALGDPIALLGLVGLAVASFVIVVTLLGRRFVDDATVTAIAAPRRPSTGRIRRHRFANGSFAAILRKELLLLARDPALLLQVLLHALYLLPLTFLLVRDAGPLGDVLASARAGAIVFLAGDLAGSLAWITISAEDAPDLIASAPATAATIRWAKMAAAVLPVTLALAIPCALAVGHSPLAGAAAFGGSVVCSISVALINLWYQKPAKRATFRRKQTGSIFARFATLLVGVLWATVTSLAVTGSSWLVVPLVAVGGILLALRWKSRQRRNGARCQADQKGSAAA
jgi:ABC-2 type transport system permease protein